MSEQAANGRPAAIEKERPVTRQAEQPATSEDAAGVLEPSALPGAGDGVWDPAFTFPRAIGTTRT